MSFFKYLSKESVNILDFFHGDSHQWKEASGSTTQYHPLHFLLGQDNSVPNFEKEGDQENNECLEEWGVEVGVGGGA